MRVRVGVGVGAVAVDLCAGVGHQVLRHKHDQHMLRRASAREVAVRLVKGEGEGWRWRVEGGGWRVEGGG